MIQALLKKPGDFDLGALPDHGVGPKSRDILSVGKSDGGETHQRNFAPTEEQPVSGILRILNEEPRYSD